MGRTSKSKNQKKERAEAQHRSQEGYGSVPHSFVFHRGRIGKTIQQLIQDVRRVMDPYTARSLKVRKKNSLKDFITVAGPLGVTHFLMFSKSPTSVNFKFVRLPGGPTLTFQVTQYSLIRDVVSTLKRHRMHEQQFTHPPLLVLNNFSLQGMHVKVMATMFQNMFPSINVHKVNLNSIKRCLLLNYNPETQLLDFRHYSLKVVPVGVSRGLKKLLQERFPNMSRLEDISELLVKDINLSESEAEQDGSHNITELPQACAGRGNMKAQQSAVRLTEIGPRMTLQLIKVEEGLNQGNVLYHALIHKTDEEIQETLARKEEKLRLKAERRQKQDANVMHKKEQREAHRKKSLEGIKKKRGQAEGSHSDAEDPGIPEDQNPAGQSDDDDAEYYRQEVGQEPDEDLFPQSAKRKRGPSPSTQPGKKRKATRPPAPGAAPKAKGQRDSRGPEGPRQRPGAKGPRQRPGAKGPRQRNGQSPQGQPRWKGPRPQAAKRRPGSKLKATLRQGKAGPRRKQAAQAKGSFRKRGRPGRKGPS